MDVHCLSRQPHWTKQPELHLGFNKVLSYSDVSQHGLENFPHRIQGKRNTLTEPLPVVKMNGQHQSLHGPTGGCSNGCGS